MSIATVRAKLNSAAQARVACWFVHSGFDRSVAGYRVLSVHADCDSANVALCDRLDSHFAANPDACGHSFDYSASSVPLAVGDTVQPASIVSFV